MKADQIPSWSRFLRRGEVQSIHQLRWQLLQALLVVSVAIGTLLIVPAWYTALQQGLPQTTILYTLLYLSLLAITLLRKLDYRLRMGGWLAIIYFLGIINLHLNGLNVDAGLFLLILVAMTFLLAGLRSGLVVFGISCLTIAVMGSFVVHGGMRPSMDLPQSDPMLWVVGGIVFLLTGTVLIVSLHVLVSGLEGQLGEIQEAKTILEAKDRRFNALLQGSTDMIALLDQDGTIRYASPSIERMLGYRPEEILGQKVYDFLHVENLSIAQLAMTPGVPEEQIGRYLELQIRHRDGSWRVLEVAGTELQDDPAVGGTVVNCRDITDRKRIEAELRAAKDDLEKLIAWQRHEITAYSERLAQLVQHSPAAIIGYDFSEAQELPFISENILQLTGYEAADFIQEPQRWASLIHPADREPALRDFMTDLKAGEAVREYRFLHRDERYRWFREEARRISPGSQLEMEYVGFILDITGQKQSEAAYASLVESSMQGVLLSQGGRMVFANRSLCDSLGLDYQEAVNLSVEQVLEHLHPEDLVNFGNIRQVLRGLSEPGALPVQFEVRWQRGSGDMRWLEIHINSLEFQLQPAFQVIVLDITARKQAELALLESEKINRLLLETTLDSVLLLDRQGIVLACNANSAQRIGRTVETMKGCCIYDLLDPVASALRREKLVMAFKSGESLTFEDQRAGRWFLHNLYPVPDGQGGVSQVAVFATDITRRKEMEEELRRQKENLEEEVATRTRELRILSQELIRAQEAERQRVSRTLHDETGQLLVGLGLSLDAVLDELPREARAARKRIKTSRELLGRVTKSFRSLARSLRPPALEISGLNTVLQDLCHEVSDVTRLQVDYHGQEIALPDVVSITLYRFVQEALTNVTKHAAARRAEVRLSLQDDQVCLTVTDDGKGMEMGKRSGGLGLLGIQERAGLLGGKVDIQSSPAGTRLTVCVPLQVDGAIARGDARDL